MATMFKRAHDWYGNPQPGDLVFFDFPDNVHRVQHVGIVAEVRQDGTLTTIEGNTSSGDHGSQFNGGGVYRRHRDRRYVVGYGRPHFTAEEDDLTPDEHEWLGRIHWHLEDPNSPLNVMLRREQDGAPQYGIEAPAIAISKTQRLIEKVAKKLGV
jgi:hypothetical protein